MADTLKKIICPACGKEMEKVFIPSEGINIDICTDGCGGIFFDNREFDYFNEQNEDISEILKKLGNKDFAPVDEGVTRVCPCCGMKMVKNSAGVRSCITVDDCYGCGGKFLDNKELLKIREEYVNDQHRSDEAIAYVYSKVGRQLTDLDKRYVKSKNKSLGQRIFNSLFDIRS